MENREKMQAVTDFLFLGSKFTVDSDCSHKIKKKQTNTYSLEESYDKPLQHIKKQRHHLPSKVCIVKPIIFPVVMYGCESWTIKKAEH